MTNLQPVLGHFARDCQPTHVAPLGAAGGMSGAEFWRIVAPRGRLVLRRWPVEHPTPDGLRFIHAVLRHAADHGIDFLPVPMATLAGETFVTHAGHLWELAPWLPGVADYENAPSEAKLRAAMTALATFHNAVADFAVADFELDGRLRPSETGPRSGPAIAPAIVTRLARVRDLEAGGAAALAQAISDSHWPKLAPLAQRFLTALPHAVPIAVTQLAPLADVKLPVQPCIRDVWHDHVLFDGDRVTGLVDFGAMQIDTPAIDVARLLGSLVREDAAGWRGGLSAYSAVRRLNEQETAAITALDTSGTILAGANWIRWIYAERRTFEMPEQVVVRFAKLLRRVERFNCPVSGGQSAAIEHGFGSP